MWTAAPLAVIAPLAALLHQGAMPSATRPIAVALGAAAIACLTAALTCVVAGMARLAGVAAGIAVSTAPAVLLRARAGVA